MCVSYNEEVIMFNRHYWSYRQIETSEESLSAVFRCSVKASSALSSAIKCSFWSGSWRFISSRDRGLFGTLWASYIGRGMSCSSLKQRCFWRKSISLVFILPEMLAYTISSAVWSMQWSKLLTEVLTWMHYLEYQACAWCGNQRGLI